MDDYRPKIELDYSSPAQEKKIQEQDEADRQEKLDNYNIATYGEKHPYLYPLARRFGLYAILIVVALLLPRWWPIRLTVGLAVTVLAIWEYNRFS